ncbi:MULTISPECIES: hypothetical protein [unclassified Streptomyces]|uniref:hypothetical protein n=1 Tax=unclassified Streptomyces TaxID=2593676 RepID=UPI000BF0089B|nr:MULTISPECIES: hypothetical protein [unclassified Streptomyces]
MNVEDLVQERIAAARRKIAADKLRREELAEARKHGLARRHAQKLARLSRYTPGTRETPADGNTPNTPDQSAPRRARGTGHDPDAFRRAGMHGNGDSNE